MNESRRLRVAVVFGGRSTEHAISCVSAGSVLSAIDRSRFDVVPIGITAEGRWVLTADDPAALAITGRQLPAVDPTGTALVLPGDPTAKGLVVLEPEELPAELGTVDVVFPLLHGPYGEDGTLQGLFELAGVPYVGSGVFASAAAMDKHHMKRLLMAAGLETPAYVVARRGRPVPVEVANLGLPVFVKPARGGSSIGITKVDTADGLQAALDEAHRHDPKALVEQAVEGREIECGVLGGPDGPQASVPAEVRVTGGQGFYDFEAKYLSDATEFDIPPRMPAELVERVRECAVQAFDALDCEGLARVDFFVTSEGRVLINEINTMPGFTPASMFPRMWAAAGVDYPTLVSRLLDDALTRGTGLR
ncbi:MAG TPA: D-alanine--D-alanine ligase family protein [Mycobacteriales bacterium]|nr:D-alanine--D-alanine ligase family protein [Mycobacteriales bacterium]